MAKIWVSIKCLGCGKVGSHHIEHLISVLKQDIRCACGSISLDWRSTKSIPQKL